MHIEVYMPEEIIVEANEILKNMYFIFEGAVEVSDLNG